MPVTNSISPSPKQLAKVLFDELGLPIIKRTKTGASTNEEVLQRLAPKHPLPAKIIEHRSLSKLKGTYLDALPKLVNPQHRPVAYLLQSGLGRDGPARVVRSEPAKHPDPHSGGEPHSQGLHPRPRRAGS